MTESDFDFQLKHVRQQAQRLAAMQDINPLSPSFGCFHYAYWRDKTSEFPDSRFQEAAATLRLLSHPSLYDPSIGLTPEQLRFHFRAGLVAWSKQQHADGSFDEWYKNEHGFAATAFTLIALGLSVQLLPLEKEDVQSWALFQNSARKAANWLSKHEDFVKLNHQMVGAAALAIAGEVLQEKKFTNAAIEKHQSVIQRQQSEGWFNEINGMDLGYCSVLLDYAMLFRKITGNQSGVDPMSKLMKFLYPFVQPNLTIPAEAGLCLNPYVSRLGVVLFADENPLAAELKNRFRTQSTGYAGISPYLSDDLRLARWGYLPLLAYYHEKTSTSSVTPVTPSKTENPESIFFDEASIGVMRSKELVVSVLPAGGGTIQIAESNGKKAVIKDLGYQISLNQKTHTTCGYSRNRSVQKIDDKTWKMELSFSPVKFLFPGFFSRLALRTAGSIPGSAVYLRKGIDWYRRSKKTSLNQSAASVSKAQSSLKIIRTVSLKENGVEIEDELIHKGKLPRHLPTSLFVRDQVLERIPMQTQKLKKKVFHDGDKLTVEFHPWKTR